MTATRHPIQVVVGYDFSLSSEQALRQAVDLVTRDPVHVLHIAAVLDPHDRITIAGHSEPATYETADRMQKLILDRVGAAFAGRPTEPAV